jgi:hypothetical protein
MRLDQEGSNELSRKMLAGLELQTFRKASLSEE